MASSSLGPGAGPRGALRALLVFISLVGMLSLTSTALAGTIDEGRGFFEGGDYANAVAALADVPEGDDAYLEARSLSGRSLDALGFSQLALFAYQPVLEAGPSSPYFEQAFNASAALSRFVGDESVYGAALVGLSQETLPPLEQGYGLYVAGLSLLNADRMAPAVAFLSAVPQGDPSYVKARLQLARALVSSGERPMAYAVLQDLYSNHREALGDIPDGLGLVTINLARLSYGMGLYQDAALDYAKVPRTSPFWPDGMMERSWATFALWQQEGSEPALRQSLGSLFALTSPAMSTLYYPEAWLLEAQIFYFLCKPKSGAAMIDDFLTRFEPLHVELGEGLKALDGDPMAFYEVALAYRLNQQKEAGAKGPIPGPFLALFLSDPSFDRVEAHLEVVDKEILAIKSQSRAWGDDLRGDFEAQLLEHGARLRAQRGAVVAKRLSSEYARLGSTIVATQVAQLELITQEMKIYEAAAAGLLSEKKEKKRRWTLPNSRSRTWPFEGEIWLDELGYYQVNTPGQCAAIGQ